MSLQQTALQNPADAGAEWVLDEGKVQDEQPNALAQQPNQDDQPADAGPQEPAPLSDLDRVALELGWTPQDEWRGDKTKWVSSAEFLRATGRVLERAKHDLKLTRRQTDELNARLARVELGQQSMAQQRADELYQQYEDAKFEAVKADDRATYDKLAAEQRKVMAEFQAAPPPEEQYSEAEAYARAERVMSDPVAGRFFEANPIAYQDERAWDLMQREMSRVSQAGGGAAAQFRAAEEALRYAYAQAYETTATPASANRGQELPRAPNGQFVSPQAQAQPQRRPAPPIAAASPRANASTAASPMDRLDADARAFLQTQIAQGAVKDGDRWARVYLGEKVSPIAPGARA